MALSARDKAYLAMAALSFTVIMFLVTSGSQLYPGTRFNTDGEFGIIETSRKHVSLMESNLFHKSFSINSKIIDNSSSMMAAITPKKGYRLLVTTRKTDQKSFPNSRKRLSSSMLPTRTSAGNSSTRKTSKFPVPNGRINRNKTISESARPIVAPNFDEEYNQSCSTKLWNKYGRFYQSYFKASKFLVYKCPPAGWGNRIRSLLSSFHLAIVAERAFIIDCVRPSPLENYLAPNSIQWNFVINSSGLSVRYQKPWYVNGTEGLGNGFSTTDFASYLNYSIEGIYNYNGIFYHKLIQNPKYNLPRWPNRFLLLGCSFNFLFKMTELLRSRLEQEKYNLGFNRNIVIGIHIRRGDMVFTHNRGDVRIAAVEDTESFFACANKIDRRIQEKYQTKKIIWFLATDSYEIKNYAKQKYPKKVRQLYGPVEHIGVPHKGNEDAGNLYMFLDLFLLQQSDFRLFTSPSTFPDAVSILTLGYANAGDSKMRNNRPSCTLPSTLK